MLTILSNGVLNYDSDSDTESNEFFYRFIGIRRTDSIIKLFTTTCLPWNLTKRLSIPIRLNIFYLDNKELRFPNQRWAIFIIEFSESTR